MRFRKNGGEKMSSNNLEPSDLEPSSHPLEVWLNKNSMTVAEFNRLLKSEGVHVTRYAIDLWLLDESTPNLRNAYAIQRATKNVVTMEKLAKHSLGG